MPPLPPTPATTGRKIGEADHLARGCVSKTSDHGAGAVKAVQRLRSIQGKSLADRDAGRREDAVLLGEAGQVVDVLGRFFGDDVDHVVDGDDAEHRAVDIGHREWRGGRSGRPSRATSSWSASGGVREHLANRQVANGGVGLCGHESADRDDTREALELVDDVEVEDGVARHRVPAARRVSIASWAVIFSSRAEKFGWSSRGRRCAGGRARRVGALRGGPTGRCCMTSGASLLWEWRRRARACRRARAGSGRRPVRWSEIELR